MVFCGHPRRWLILLGCGRASSLSPSIARLQQSLFIIFVSMEDSYLIGAFGELDSKPKRSQPNYGPYEDVTRDIRRDLKINIQMAKGI